MMIRYAELLDNDIVNGKGVCVSLWMQGCPHRCFGCHNKELWSFEGGKEKSLINLTQEINEKINKNGIKRNFSILGGEPLCPENFIFTLKIVDIIRELNPNIKIFIWTGYELKNHTFQIEKISKGKIKELLEKVDVIIDGTFDITKRDVTLELRGSANQRILKKNIDF